MSLSKGSGPFGENRTGAGNYRIDLPLFYNERVEVEIDGLKSEK